VNRVACLLLLLQDTRRLRKAFRAAWALVITNLARTQHPCPSVWVLVGRERGFDRRAFYVRVDHLRVRHGTTAPCQNSANRRRTGRRTLQVGLDPV
jgi:hypothetical protein